MRNAQRIMSQANVRTTLRGVAHHLGRDDGAHGVWKWNSDGMAAWKPRDSRLFVEYKIAVGEVTETASEAEAVR